MASKPKRALSGWLRRNDWALYETATQAIEERDAFAEGVSEVKKSQLRAVLNTARMCPRPGAFEHFVEKRKDRREKEARQSDDEGLRKRAEFWGALEDHVGQILEDYATPAIEEITEETGGADPKVETAQMRVLRAYLEHFISHCHVKSR